ncbi:hypothetical protein Vafri_13043 [Volvox africanus]|uniref:Uncharacterized protein n=1 Tax=Volvox africanus TaxID=51714 RepID=A0A8J4BB98_9CHLO|nr:hypothetical protein Vafri_13043 [Volvox africanus]
MNPNPFVNCTLPILGMSSPKADVPFRFIVHCAAPPQPPCSTALAVAAIRTNIRDKSGKRRFDAVQLRLGRAHNPPGTGPGASNARNRPLLRSRGGPNSTSASSRKTSGRHLLHRKPLTTTCLRSLHRCTYPKGKVAA